MNGPRWRYVMRSSRVSNHVHDVDMPDSSSSTWLPAHAQWSPIVQDISSGVHKPQESNHPAVNTHAARRQRSTAACSSLRQSYNDGPRGRYVMYGPERSKRRDRKVWTCRTRRPRPACQLTHDLRFLRTGYQLVTTCTASRQLVDPHTANQQTPTAASSSPDQTWKDGQ